MRTVLDKHNPTPGLPLLKAFHLQQQLVRAHITLDEARDRAAVVDVVLFLVFFTEDDLAHLGGLESPVYVGL